MRVSGLHFSQLESEFVLFLGDKLQALVYHILPPTTAIIDYAIGLEKLPATGQVYLLVLRNGNKLVTDNSDCIKCFFYNHSRCSHQYK